jgi:hypothetical protein
MLHNAKPSAEPILLVVLSGLVAVMVSFGALLYWAAQPTVLTNAPIAHFHAEMRRAMASANAVLALESKRTLRPVAEDLDQRGLDRLVRQVASTSGHATRQ